MVNTPPSLLRRIFDFFKGLIEDQNQSPAEKRVVRGAKLLDRIAPGWYLKVPQNRLHMRGCLDCIVGMVYGDFARGMDFLRSQMQPFRLRPSDYGFSITEDQNYSEEIINASYEALDRYWIKQIKKRLGEPVDASETKIGGVD